jgi:hypothetical protein
MSGEDANLFDGKLLRSAESMALQALLCGGIIPLVSDFVRSFPVSSDLTTVIFEAPPGLYYQLMDLEPGDFVFLTPAAPDWPLVRVRLNDDGSEDVKLFDRNRLPIILDVYDDLLIREWPAAWDAPEAPQLLRLAVGLPSRERAYPPLRLLD